MRLTRNDKADLGEVEKPTDRADVAIERQTHEMTATMGDLRLQTASDEPVRSPSGMATAGLKTAVAGLLATAPFITGGCLLHAPAWLALGLAMLAFLLVVLGTGVVVVAQEFRHGAAHCTVRPSRFPPGPPDLVGRIRFPAAHPLAGAGVRRRWPSIRGTHR